MNRLHLFILIVAIIFVPILVSVLSTSQQTAHADDENPPIEYWLDRHSEIGHKNSSNNYDTPMIFKKKLLTMGKHPSHNVHTRLALGATTVHEKPCVKLKNLNVYKLNKNNSLLYQINVYGNYFWWYGIKVDAKTYYYKEGRFVESFSSSHYMTPKRDPYGSIWGTETSNKISRDGTYILHIKKATALAEYYKESNQYTFAEDVVFAFQIGNDDFCDNFNG